MTSNEVDKKDSVDSINIPIDQQNFTFTYTISGEPNG